MIMRFTITTLVYIAIGLMISVGCIRLMSWLFSENQRASLINQKWPYFLVIPPIANFIIMLLVYDEQIYSAFRASALGFQFRDNYGALAYYLLGWPMVVTVLLSIIIAALFVFLKMPKSEFEKRGLEVTDKELKISENKDVLDIKKIKSELQEIEDSSLLKGFLIKIKRVCKSKYDAEILEAFIDLRRKNIEGIITDREYIEEQEKFILAEHSHKNVGKKTNLHDLKLQRKILEEEKAIKDLSKGPEDELEEVKRQGKLNVSIKHAKEEIEDREVIHDAVRNALNEIRTRKALKDEAHNWKMKIMKDDQLNDNEKLVLIEDIDDIVQNEITKLQ